MAVGCGGASAGCNVMTTSVYELGVSYAKTDGLAE